MRGWWAYVLSFAILGALGAVFAKSFPLRMTHHAGYDLPHVEDEVVTPNVPHPRHTVLVVVDGLGGVAARGMQTVARLGAVGQCLDTDVGSLPVSRPVYASLSSGVEPERTGVRSNAPTDPAHVDSVWDVATRHGRHVIGVSEIGWWAELFPHGFERFYTLQPSVDFAAVAPLADLTLVHPDYVDDAGHDFGGASQAYADAVKRADTETLRLLDRLDLERDLIVFTADHGHVALGGHGGHQPEVKHVITCFAGRGVRHDTKPVAITSRTIGPAITALLGLPFPHNMRATDDDLDAIFWIMNPEAYPLAYFHERQRAVQHFRLENAQFVAGLLGTTQNATWGHFYAERLREVNVRGVVNAGAFALALMVALANLGFGAAVMTLLWSTMVLAAAGAAWVLLRGSFDLSSANTQAYFVPHAFATMAAVIVVAALLRLAMLRRARAWVDDLLTLCAIGAGLLLVHVGMYGWPIGPTMPPPALYFFPYIGSFFVMTQAAFGIVATLITTVVLAIKNR